MARRFQIATWLFIAVGWATFGAQNLVAQPQADRKSDEAAVRQAGKDYLAALERGDAAAAEYWTADGTYTDLSGRTVKVRELHAAAKEGKGKAATISPGVNIAVRFVGQDVAIEEGDYSTSGGDDQSSIKCHYTALWVRDGKRWKLDSVQERPIAPATETKLPASLDAFVGQWTGEENKIAINISAKWDANRKFLSRRISMASGKATVIATQTIGWDPISQQIRSWTFCDDGSYSEGVWSLEGNAWMALSNRVLADGKTSEYTQVYKFPDKNTIVWRLIRCAVDGQPTEDQEIVLKRAAAQ